MLATLIFSVLLCKFRFGTNLIREEGYVKKISCLYSLINFILAMHLYVYNFMLVMHIFYGI